MSWISGLADKAENILNKIDQNAATALQVPVAGSSSYQSIRKSRSSGALSLKPNFSPSKLSIRSLGATGSDSGSVKSEGGFARQMTDSLESKEKIDWANSTLMNSSQISAPSDNVESIAIDVGDGDIVESEGGKHSIHPAIKPAVNKFTVSKESSSFSMENQELAAFKIALSEVTNERDELRLRLSMLNNDVENAALKQRAQEFEILVQRLTEERDQSQQELHDSQTTNVAYVHSISELETNLAKLQQEYVEVANKLQMQLRETEHQRTDLEEYRKKAQLALQIKDNLITELKSNGSSSGSTAHVDSDKYLLQLEFDALKQEHQHLLEENRNTMLQLDETRRELHMLTKQHTEQLSCSHENEEILRKELRAERERVLATESEQRVVSQELDKLRQQLSNHMAATATRLQEKEQQLHKLQKSQRPEKNSISEESQLNYDTRVRTLTQALVDKQNAMENITSERNALRIQLEKLQDQLQQQTVYSSRVGSSNSRTEFLSNTTDDVKAQFPFLLRENPFDNRIARRVKRAYFSFERFLRRYPLMRLLVLMYVGLLHIWVIFVLLSSTPN